MPETSTSPTLSFQPWHALLRGCNCDQLSFLGWDHPQLRTFFSQQMRGLGSALGSAFLAYQMFATWRSAARQSALIQRFKDVTTHGQAENIQLQTMLANKTAEQQNLVSEMQVAQQSLLSQAQHFKESLLAQARRLESQRNASLAAATKFIVGAQANTLICHCLVEWKRLVMTASYDAAKLQHGYKRVDDLTKEQHCMIMRQYFTKWSKQASVKSKRQSVQMRIAWLVERMQIDFQLSLCCQYCLLWKSITLHARLSAALQQAHDSKDLAAAAAKMQEKIVALLHRRSSETTGSAFLQQCVHRWRQLTKDRKLRNALEKTQEQSRLVEAELEECKKATGRKVIAMLQRSVSVSSVVLVEQCFRGWHQSMRLNKKRVVAMFQRSVASTESTLRQQCFHSWVQLVELERVRIRSMQKNSAILQMYLQKIMKCYRGPELRVVLTSWRSLCPDSKLERRAGQGHEVQVEQFSRQAEFTAWHDMGSACPAVPPPPPGALTVPREDWGLGNANSALPAWSSPVSYGSGSGAHRGVASMDEAWRFPCKHEPQFQASDPIDETCSSSFLIDEEQWRRTVQERKEKEAVRKQQERSRQQVPEASQPHPGKGKCSLASSGARAPHSLEINSQIRSMGSSDYFNLASNVKEKDHFASSGARCSSEMNSKTNSLGGSDYFNLASCAMVSEDSYRKLLEYNRRELHSRRGQTLRA